MEKNIFEEKLNNFTLFSKTEEMEIVLFDNKRIFLKEILDAIKNCNDIGFIKLENHNLDIEITYIDQITFCFEILGKSGYKILRTPIIIEIAGKKMEIVCTQQLQYFLSKNYTNPKILCSCGKKSDVTIRNLNTHIGHSFTIFEFEEIQPLFESQIENIIQNHRKGYLGKTFISPEDFDINFNHYFKLGETENILHGLFNVFDDTNSTRSFITYEFTNCDNFGNKLIYFGAPGKGKSITLIGALKYTVIHKKTGTLYFNCKTFKILSEKQQFTLIRKILSDEILYLFYENYKNYLSCFKMIQTFNFLLDTSFWNLIDLILKECMNINKKFIIGIDQYNNSNDPNNYLNKLEEKYLKNNKNKQFMFIIISSMNETDIRQQKIKLLFEENISKNVYELNSVCNNFITNFNEDELKVLNKLGKTFKSYNEIKLLKDKNELNDYLKKKKKKYLYKIISFYKKDKKVEKFNVNISEEDIMNSSDNIYVNFLSFKINYEYTKSELMKIIDFIPFRFFNINEKYGKYTVITGFPLIDEILDDIFRYIVVNKNFYIFKKLANNKGSAFSSLFEYKVRYSFYPQIKGEIDYFKNFIIQESVSMEVIIPKDNETKEAKFIKNLELGKTYLVEQKQFGGKELDFLIIHISENPEVFGFQVSTYKEKIFTSLEKTYNILLNRLNISFNLKIHEAYFGYIFDYSRIKDPLYKSMLKKCKNNKMKYSFYDTDSNILFDDKFKRSNNIYDLVGKINSHNIFNKNENYQNININYYNPIHKLSGNQISIIIDILKAEKNDYNISSIYFVKKESNILCDENYVSIVDNYTDNLVIFFYHNRFLISKTIISNKEINDNKDYFSDNFDIYEIIKNKNI